MVRLRQWARAMTRDVHALSRAARDPRVPWYAKVAAIAVAAYALSPIDLIPDVIPVLGYLDDLVLVPLGILLVVRLVPPALMTEFRAAATAAEGEGALGRRGATFIVIVWIAVAALVLWWFARSAIHASVGATAWGTPVPASPEAHL